MNSREPRVHWPWWLHLARIMWNQRSFQIGIMVKTATVAMAGSINGSTSLKKIAYSDMPSICPAFFKSSILFA